MKRDKYFAVKTDPFALNGQEQFVTVEDSHRTLSKRLGDLNRAMQGLPQADYGQQTLRRRVCDSLEVVDEVDCPTTALGCEIMEIKASTSGNWLVTQRCSGQGEWGYDVFSSRPLARRGGTFEEYGYMLDLPQFSSDESVMIGGFGENWLGGWWAHEGDEYGAPARGGLISFGYLFVHQLVSHHVERHELKMNLPRGWLPDDFEGALSYGARGIAPLGDGVRLLLPGGIPFEIKGPLPPVILLPTPDPAGGKLLAK